MKKKYVWHPMVLVKNLLILAFILFCLWGIISYGEILIKNTSIDTRPIYSDWNLWVSVLGGGR